MPNRRPELSDFWAKTDRDGLPSMSVATHCLHVGAVAEALTDMLPLATQSLIPAGGVCLIAAHDIGKISPGFQLKCPAWRARWQACLRLSAEGHETRHAWASQKFLAGCYASPPRWLMAVGGHHGRYLCGKGRPTEMPFAPNPIGDGLFQTLRNELLGILKEQFGELPPSKEIEKGARLHWFTGLMIFCDWIGSNAAWFPPDANSLGVKKAIIQANTALAEVGIHHTSVTPGKDFSDLFGFDAPRPLQKTLLEVMDGPGLYIVEAPMGDGKTEAALAGAYQRWTQGGERGLYFALPTQLTSNRMRDRVEDFIQRIVAEESALALTHGNAWLTENRIRPVEPQPLEGDKREFDNARESNKWFSDSRRAMLAPFGVGTIDQALMAVVPVKYSALRMFGLGGKVVVIDEVHSYDPFTSAWVDLLVKWLIELGGTVIVLSATLTATRRASLVAAAGGSEKSAPQTYPLVTKVAANNACAEHFSVRESRQADKEVLIESIKVNDERWMREVVQAASNQACVLVIRNTVELARETYHALKSFYHEGDVEFGLIHSRFTQADRNKNETRWTELLGRDGRLRPRHGAVLVGTQVLEQSLDIDADLLVTDLAPTDLLLQRIGRLHRHQRTRPHQYKKPRCIALRPDVHWDADRAEIEEALTPHRFIYPPFALYKADTVWGGLESIVVPKDMRSILDKSSSASEPMPDAVRELWKEMEIEADQMRRTTWMNDIFKTPAVGDTEGAQTRWKIQPSAGVVILTSQPTRCGRQIQMTFLDGCTRTFDESVFDFPLARLLQLHAVRVPAYLVRGIAQPAWLANHLDNAVLAVKDETNRIQFWPEMSVPHEFSYSPETGFSFFKARTQYNPEEDESWY